jgi:hypothetical protein
VFLKNGSVATVLRFPRPGPPEGAFPAVISTIKALRLPAPNTASLIYSLCRSNFPLHVRSRALEILARARSRLKPRHHWLLKVGRTQDLPGSWRIHPIPLPRSRTSAGSPDLTITVSRCRSRQWDGKNTSIAVISRLNHAASVSAAYASRACRHALCKARFRWMASPCRVGVEPTGFH